MIKLLPALCAVIAAAALSSCTPSDDMAAPTAAWADNIRGVSIRAEIRTGHSGTRDWPDELRLFIRDRTDVFSGLYHPGKDFVTGPMPGTPDGISGAGDVFVVKDGRLVNMLYFDADFRPHDALPPVRK